MFDALLSKIRAAKAAIIREREAEAMRMALDGIALVKLRIQTKGQNAALEQFSPYAPAYAKERKASGYQVSYVDFTRTGQMWASVRPVVESNNDTQTVVVIGSTNARGQGIIEGARPKRGDILAFSRQEIDLIAAANRKRVEKHLNFGL